MTSGVKLVRNGAEHARRLEALIENEGIEVKKAPEVLWSSRTEVWSQLHEKGLMNECEAKLRLKLSALSVELALRESTSVTDSVRLLDEALILGHPSFKYLCSSMVDELAPIDGALRVRHEPMALLGHERIREIAVNMMEAQNLMETIPSVERPSIAQFLSRIFWKGPRIISGVVSKWPAFRKWNDFKFWEAEHGHRWVPVELGSKYTDPSFETQMIPISDFVDQHLRGESGGYLAQHQLFEQVPSLLRDIIEPEFASLGESSSEAVVNMWLGPSGTQTPLHHDPYHNLLCQVFGAKLLVVFPPEEFPNLYPFAEDTMFGNTSQVDVVRPDESRFPLYHQARGFKLVLHAGEMLYLPPKWWHFVASLDISCSVSFWFT